MTTSSSDWQRCRDLSKSITFYLSPEDAERLAEARRHLRPILDAKIRRLQDEGVLNSSLKPKKGASMKYSFSYTDSHGLTSSFAVSVSEDASKLLCGDSEAVSSTDDLEETFQRALPGMLQEHLRAHRQSVVSLVSASIKHLEKQKEQL